MAFLMSCKEAVRLHSESLDRKLSLAEKVALHCHLLICRACERYCSQIDFVRHSVKMLVKREESGTECEDLKLSPQAIDRIQQAMKEASA